MRHIGKVFHEYDSDSAPMIVLEGDKPLGDDAHRFYDALVGKLEHDTKHVEHVQNFWGDPLTAAGSQSKDGKAAYVQVYLAGNQGDALANESVDAIRNIVEHTPPPQGVKAYVTGAPLVTDQFEVGSKGIFKVTVITVLVILAMLLWVYRSVTAVFVLVTVIVEMAAARGIVAFLGSVGLIGLSTYATNLLTLLVIAAGTDYAIFFVGRYHEARHEGQDRETAYYTMYRGTTHVVLGSGLTVAGAVLCLRFTRLNYFQSLGIPAAIGIGVALAAALSLTPAVITVGSLFGLFDPKRQMATRGGGASAPRSCGGRRRFSSPPWRSRWSGCWRCRITGPAMTTRNSFRTASRRTWGLRRRRGISPASGCRCRRSCWSKPTMICATRRTCW